jgi:hypothetical protein
VERGYEDMAGKLASIGAQIERVAVDSEINHPGHSYE